MNLLHEPWLPVRGRDGSREWIASDRLSDPDIVAFDADRPDFNGALAQFAIGLLQTTTPMDSPIVWKQLFANPPDAATLNNWFAPVAAAFELDGDGARFMQDRTLVPPKNRSEKGGDIGGFEPFQQLLIDCAGEGEKAKDNTDHFIKRKTEGFGACPACAAAALYTLQSSAPGGGRGFLVSVRGGGPLTTLLLCAEKRSLWHDLWLNVCERGVFLERSGDRNKIDPPFTYPWLKDIRVLQPGGVTAIYFEGEKGKPKPTEEEKPKVQPMQLHPSHVFWAMPRRIRLDFNTVSEGNCGICGRMSERLVRQYVTKNYGLNYKGAWDHPLSPYYEKDEKWLPLHPQPGGLGYRHWLGWVIGMCTERKKQRRARVVDHVLAHRQRQIGGQLRLWAFGYDMDNMKARCWYESTLPLFGLADCGPDAHRRVESEVGLWLAGAELAAFYLRGAVKDAWFSAGARGDFSAIDSSFWGRTEPEFYRQLKSLIETVRDNRELHAVPVRDAWQRLLIKAATDLFDEEFDGAGPVERQNPHRVAKAFQQLDRNLRGRNQRGPNMRQTLGLPPLEGSKPKENIKAAKAAA